jgi:putative flippase GtrA
VTLDSWQITLRRWLKFNAVGGIGIGVQLAVLAVLKSGLHLDYLLATGLAVEAAVIHNFLWHERYTWADRSGGNSILRLAKFNLTTGMSSILGNLAAMKLLVGVLGLPYLPANGITIAACSSVNFVVSDRVVFEPAGPKAAREA